MLALAQGFIGSLFASILKLFAAVGSLLLSIFLSLAIFLVTIIRRSLAKSRQRQLTT